MRAFITGVSGQDGSFLAEQLLERGAAVYGLVRRNSTGHHPRIAGLPIATLGGDITDLGSVLDAVRIARPDVVYNLAAQSSVADSFLQPSYTAAVVAQGAANVFEAVRRLAPDARVYQASSSEMYGDANSPQGLRTPFWPRSPYAAAKVQAHHLAINARETWGLQVSCGILFNHESHRRGPDFVTRHVALGVARIARGLAKRERPQPLPIGNLDARRDWGWAPDYTRAMQAIMAFPEAREWVIATGYSHSVRDLLRVAFAHVDLHWEDWVKPDASRLRPCEVPDLRGDAAEAQLRLQWAPSVGFEDMVRGMVDAELA